MGRIDEKEIVGIYHTANIL